MAPLFYIFLVISFRIQKNLYVKFYYLLTFDLLLSFDKLYLLLLLFHLDMHLLIYFLNIHEIAQILYL